MYFYAIVTQNNIESFSTYWEKEVVKSPIKVTEQSGPCRYVSVKKYLWCDKKHQIYFESHHVLLFSTFKQAEIALMLR
jgi:hypothetical protein